jgi:acylphosphatase
MTTPTRRLEAVIHGRVQGVGFRHFAWRRALQCGLLGQVRNLPDGSVEVIAEGEEPHLLEFLGQLRLGPGSARVDRIDEGWAEPTLDFSSFEIVG